MKREELYESIDRQAFAEKIYRKRLKEDLNLIKEKILKDKKMDLIAEKIYRAKIRYDLKMIIEKKETVKYSSTGLNTLDDLFMNSNLLSSLETGFNSLTTSAEQRKDYKNHVIQAIINIFNQVDVTADKSNNLELTESFKRLLEEEDPDITIDVVDDDLPEDKVVGPEKREREEAEEDDPEDENAGAIDPNEDVTGRNKAGSVISKIEKSIKDYYVTLGNPSDRCDYQIYMLANLEMYFKKWEDSLRNDVTPESQPEVDQAIADAEAELDAGGEGEGEGIETEEGAEELDLDF